MAIAISKISDRDAEKLLNAQESHFFDAKSVSISPAKLTNTISAFANADGGEIYVGLEDNKGEPFKWAGFFRQEDANGHIQIFESLFPLGDYFSYEIIENKSHQGLLLKCDVLKNPEIKFASNGTVYLRRRSKFTTKSARPDSSDRIKQGRFFI